MKHAERQVLRDTSVCPPWMRRAVQLGNFCRQDWANPMLLLLLLLSIEFAPQQTSVNNRQPHLAVDGDNVALAFGAGNTIYFASSQDAGATWTKPIAVSSRGSLSLGMRRGPRIAISRNAIVVSAIVGEKGRGADGDLMAWRSVDGGKTWGEGRRVNDVAGSAREGLHAMAAGGEAILFATWLDLRSEGTKLFGAMSRDGGATWSENRLVYESPSGSVCECCHPTAYVDERGRVFVMFRNWLDGNRDMYLVRSDDGGRTFGPARKLGSGSWRLNACPMDGGSMAVGADGKVTTVWRREGTVYRSGIGGDEEVLGSGRQPVAVATPRGIVVAWTEGKVLKWAGAADAAPQTFAGEMSFPSIGVLRGGGVLVAGERNGSVFVAPLQ